jgi:hypothetical protein
LTCSISRGGTAKCRFLEQNKYVCMYVCRIPLPPWLYALYYLKANCLHLYPQLTDRLRAVCCRCNGTGTLRSIMTEPATAIWCVWGRWCYSVLLRGTATKDTWVGEVWGEHPSCSLGCSLWLTFLHLFLCVSSGPITGGIGSAFANWQLVAAVLLRQKMYVLLQDTPCAGEPLAAKTTGCLLAVYANVVEHLAVMALRKTILSFIGFYPECDVAGRGLTVGFCIPRQGC